MTNNRTPAQVAAQVAVEAVINDPRGYDPEVWRSVWFAGRETGVSEFYLDMLLGVTIYA